MILTKAVLVQMYSEDTVKRQSDESIFSNLASVACLWWSSIKKYNFRSKIRHLSKVYFQRTKMRSTIIRNNWDFLNEVIHPDKIIFPLESYGCLTEDQVTFLTRLRNYKNKSHELLLMLQNFSSQEFHKFIDCLFSTNQTPAALILERGGEAVKVRISNGNATRTKEFEMKFIERFRRIQTENTHIPNDMLNSSIEKRLNDVVILHTKQNKGIELWFWCKTESSLNQLKSLSDEALREIMQLIYRRLIPEHRTPVEPHVIEMDHAFAKAFAERRLSIRHVGERERYTDMRFILTGAFSKFVTSLADKIYVAQESRIFVFQNKYPYQSLKPIVFGEVFLPISIASCNINKCLYVSSSIDHYIYKVEPEFDNRISEWLPEARSFIISVTSKGDILVLKTRDVKNLRIFTHKGKVKCTISLENHFDEARIIQEIMPDIVAVVYEKPAGFRRSCIAIMRLDENGTVLRNIEWKEEIVGISSFRYGDLCIGVSLKKRIADNFSDSVCVNFVNGSVQLHHWPLESKITRDLLKTDEAIDCIHFAADQKQLYVLSGRKLDIYQLNYEDEDYDRSFPSFSHHSNKWTKPINLNV